jgi:hypothetical protein
MSAKQKRIICAAYNMLAPLRNAPSMQSMIAAFVDFFPLFWLKFNFWVPNRFKSPCYTNNAKGT